MGLLEFLDKRLRFTARHRGIFDRPVPEHINYFYCFGGIAFTLFIVLLLTGLLLSMHYIPSETEAYKSIQRLHDSVPLGGFMRSVHYWAANLMVVMVTAHMLRVFITGSYKNPRELNWVSGVVLFVITLGFGFTGYLLPWDQKAYWATVVGTNMIGSIPLAGGWLSAILLGGSEVSGQTLLRFYSLHVLWLPLLSGVFMWMHFHMLRRLGVSGRL